MTLAASIAQSGANNVTMRNKIINGSMMIDQRNAGASFTQTTSTTYTLDRFAVYGTAASKFSVQQSSTAPAGFSKSMLLTSLSAYTLGANNIYFVKQAVEGNNVSDLNWGTANAQTVTLSFWARSSLTGTFSGAVANSDHSRSYPFTFTINSANTWEQKTATIPGDTSGTWATDNTIGLQIFFNFGANTLVGPAGAWASATYIGTSGSTSLVSTNAATFYITGVQLEKGTTATAFEQRLYGTELALCQRYYAKMSGSNGNYCGFGSGRITASGNADIFIKFPTSMRSAPTIAASNTAVDSTVYTATTTISTQYTGFDSALCSFTISGATAGQGATLIGANNSAAFISLSSEL